MKYVQPIGGAANDPYIDGNPGAGIEGSAVPAGAIEDPQREIVAAIVAAGLTPTDADLAQLAAAIPILAGFGNLLKQRGTTIASAGTTNIGAADSDYAEISGTTTITSLGTTTSRNHMWVKFQGILTLTHNGTSLILPTATNIVTAAGDHAEFVRISGGNWECINYLRASGQPLVGPATPLGQRGTAIASGATTDIGAADSSHVEISGGTTINSLGASTNRDHVWVTFQSSLTLTHNGTSLILPTNANIVTAAGDCAEFVRVSGSNWRCLNYERANGKPLADPLGAKGTTIASASTIDVGAADSSHVEISGGTTVTSLGSSTARNHVFLEFQSALTLTHNGTTLILPSGANILTAAGDCAEFVRTSGSNWRCINYERADGKQVAAIQNADLPVGNTLQSVAATYTSNADLATAIPNDDTIPQNTEGTEVVTVTITPVSATSIIELDFRGMIASNASVVCSAALFKDSGANAIQASCGIGSSTLVPGQIGFIHREVAGSTAARTYRVRVGSASSSCRMNGTQTGTRFFGGVSAAYLVAREIKA